MKLLVASASIFALGFAAGLPRQGQPCPFQVGQEVRTTSGIVIGKAAPKLTEVSEYLGIPYAKPPVGQLRFAAPERFVGYGKINATSYVRISSRLSKVDFDADKTSAVSVGNPERSIVEGLRLLIHIVTAPQTSPLLVLRKDWQAMPHWPSFQTFLKSVIQWARTA